MRQLHTRLVLDDGTVYVYACVDYADPHDPECTTLCRWFDYEFGHRGVRYEYLGRVRDSATLEQFIQGVRQWLGTPAATPAAPKYELRQAPGAELRQLVALRSFGDVKAGDLGGLIAPSVKLDHNSTAWVYPGAEVYGCSEITNGATIFGAARVMNSKIADSTIFERAHVTNSSVCGSSVYGNARVCARSIVQESEIAGKTVVEHSEIDDSVLVDCTVSGNVFVTSVELRGPAVPITQPGSYQDGPQSLDVWEIGRARREYVDPEMKYELSPAGAKYSRPVALCDFGDVKRGDIGGLIADSATLSREGTCWVYPDAVVHGTSVVSDNAIVDNKAVLVHSRVEGSAYVGGPCTLFDSTCKESTTVLAARPQQLVLARCTIGGYARVLGDGNLYGVRRHNSVIENETRIEVGAKR